MSKMTKAQKKRMVKDILNKTKKLFMSGRGTIHSDVASTKDMEAIERLCAKWMKRIG